ncbi:uncharacterized mitochondrial protein AtMg00810-like [Cannabis sativa]|uniref:uncharacterized mitochondrial protein AtMg00810-like n=1 Tax=Cannabis sativa TaxID=3483 RepID=UPI0029CAA092|nr:uncharacterized mitochondrial protein AtMg00810-like [Cannabis sativa]
MQYANCKRAYTDSNKLQGNDDIVVATNSLDELHHFTTTLDSHFKLKDLGPLHFFLGLEIARCNKGISVSQRSFTLQLLQEADCLAIKPVSTPMETNIKLNNETGKLLTNPIQYRSLIATRILQYLKNTPGQGLFFHAPTPEPIHLQAFADADWAACIDTRRSISGYCIFLPLSKS